MEAARAAGMSEADGGAKRSKPSKSEAIPAQARAGAGRRSGAPIRRGQMRDGHIGTKDGGYTRDGDEGWDRDKRGARDDQGVAGEHGICVCGR